MVTILRSSDTPTSCPKRPPYRSPIDLYIRPQSGANLHKKSRVFS